MANEVEIVVTGQNRSGPAMAAARADARKTGDDIRRSLSKSGRDGGKDAGDGIKDGIESGTRRGGQIVADFAGGVMGTFSRLGPGMSAAIVAGVYGAAASAGAAAGAVALAAGGAITAIGVVSAAQSVKVRREWSETGRELKASLADAAQPLETSAIRAATVTRTTFSRLKPYLTSFFDQSAPAVDRFVKSIGDGVASLGPALQPLQRGYSAVLDAISARSPAIFGSLERSIENLGRTAEEHADDIAYAFQFVASAVERTTQVIDYMADSWDRFVDNVESTKDAGQDFGTGLRETLYEWARALGIDTEQMRETEASWAAVDRAAAQTQGVDAAKDAAGNLSGSARDAAAGLRDLKASMEELNGPALDSAEAQIRVEEAIDRAAESIRKNGRTLDVNTEKGRANKEALIDLARAAQGHIAAMQAEGASTSEIAEKYGQYRTQLIRAARQAGLTKGAAERLAEAWMKTPDEVVTHARGDLSDLESKLAIAKAQLRDPKLTRPERTRLRAEISDLQAKVRAAKAALASLRNRTVTVTVRTVGGVSTYSAGGVRASTNAHGGIIGGIGARRFQAGGVSGSGSSLAMVGEQGPELVRLPFGSTVTPAGQTRSVMGGGFGSISMAFRSAQSSGLGGAGGLRDSMREIVSFREALEKLSSTLIGQTRAVSAYEAAWDAAGKSLKENGKRLSLTTERGRENRGALMDLAEAAREVIIAMHEQGRSTTTLISRMKEQRSEFIKMARSMGLSKSEASAMADRVGLTTAGVRSALAASSGKASGGPAGGWTMVGERGAELVRLPFGSSVVPAGQSATMMAAAAPAPVVLELRSSGSAVDDMLLKILRNAVRVRGGNVQLVLGRS